jgi:hypothetical protein
LQKRKAKYNDEEPYDYQPDEQYAYEKETALESYRIPHKAYFRKDYKG